MVSVHFISVRLLLSVCIALTALLPALSQSSVEYQVKAVYLFNFAKFVEWPRQAFSGPNVTFTICLAGDPFDGALAKTIQGETVNNRPLTIRRLTGGENVTGCHILYVSRSESARFAEILSVAANAAILTVGETEDFINSGGMIRFVEAGQRIRFEINPDAAERGSLKVSSRLLRLADIVRPRQRAGNP
jgi:hypothetical protein